MEGHPRSLTSYTRELAGGRGRLFRSEWAALFPATPCGEYDAFRTSSDAQLDASTRPAGTSGVPHSNTWQPQREERRRDDRGTKPA